MSRPATRAPDTPAMVNDQKAVGLVLAFVTAVILVLGLATMPPIPIAKPSTDSPIGPSQIENGSLK